MWYIHKRIFDNVFSTQKIEKFKQNITMIINLNYERSIIYAKLMS